MSERRRCQTIAWIAIVLAVSAQACATSRVKGALPSAGTATAPVVSPPSIPSTPTRVPAIDARIATGGPTVRSADRLTVTATKGNIFIRRGPDFGFNAIGVLYEGQSAAALARDVLGGWVEVPMPGQPNQTGWISIQSQFTVLDGDVMTLQEVDPTFFPVTASLRNCTLDQMLVTPGNIVLPSVVNFPANEVRVNPGVYVVLDTDVDGYPGVLKVEIREGSSIDVRTDGNGEKRKCPVP